MGTNRSSQPPPTERPSSPEGDATSPVARGCFFLLALAFILGGLLPALALLGVFPREEYFGGQPAFPIVVGSLALFFVGIYLFVAFIRAAAGLPPPSGRTFANLVVLAVAVPLHWWLFFVWDTQAVGGLPLPGGIIVFTRLNLPPFQLVLGKVGVGLLCLILDLILISEIFGLGWFRWVSAWEQKEPPDEEEW